MDYPTSIGLIAAFLTTMAFVPQVIKVVRTRSTHDISLITFLGLCVGISLWLHYGYMIQDLPLMLANGVTLILAGTILVYKLRYK